MEIQERHKFVLGLNIELLKLGWHQSGVSWVFRASGIESRECFAERRYEVNSLNVLRRSGLLLLYVGTENLRTQPLVGAGEKDDC